jgi:hypothetical protein
MRSLARKVGLPDLRKRPIVVIMEEPVPLGPFPAPAAEHIGPTVIVVIEPNDGTGI